MDQIRILIVDDHPLFRDGLRSLLESVPDMQVIGETMTGNEVIVQAASLQPDVILSKLQVADRTEAMHAAWIAGIGQEDAK